MEEFEAAKNSYIKTETNCSHQKCWIKKLIVVKHLCLWQGNGSHGILIRSSTISISGIIYEWKEAIVELIVFEFSYIEVVGYVTRVCPQRIPIFLSMVIGQFHIYKIKVHVPLSPDGQYLRSFQPFFVQYFFWTKTSREIQVTNG